MSELLIVDFQELTEQIDDLHVIAERKNEPTIPHEKILEELNKDGLIEHYDFAGIRIKKMDY